MKLKNQSGQSLIETIGAIFILTMALTTALGLAVYAFSRSGVSQNQIVATNLAREGIDVVRGMRDSNWLASAAKGGQWDLQTCSDIGDQLCFPKIYAKIPGHNNYDLNAGNQRLVFNTSSQTWSLNSTADYDLYVQSDGTYSDNVIGGASYARMINITFNSAAPFTSQNSNQEMIVKSVVAWRGKNCTEFTTSQDLLALTTPCKTVTEEHMTNWKNYR